jgi:nucleoside-diphosphate-sugar epimerase
MAPRAAVSAMLDVTVDGTIQLIESFQPARFLFASSCAVYGDTSAGDTSAAPAPPDWSAVHPLSTFGLTKAMAELVLREWSSAGAGRAMVLRFGNINGAGAKGLISYLVRHALQYPDGSIPAVMRGGGKLIRDYLPVAYAVRVMRAALDAPWNEPCETLNVGSGFPRSNRDVAAIVRETLGEFGIRLRIEFANLAGFGEARAAVLHCQPTNRRFGLTGPTEEEVVGSIRDTVIARIAAARLMNRAAAM